MTRNFNPSREIEISKKWLITTTESSNKFYIPMPPPNITGKLHMGHALFVTLQDIIIRYHRILGHDVLWIPGTDHAGIATNDKLLSNLRDMGNLDPSREEFIEYSSEWRNSTQFTITNQIRRLGASCDWSRERFTLDDSYNKSVIHAFIKCHEMGLVYHRDNQWWLDMSSISSDILNEYESGNIRIIPDHSGKTFSHFLRNIEPWCISRQIWWGHRMPIYVDDLGNFHISEVPIDGMTQIPDVFDTWFSSSLWPFAILGWPDRTDDFERYYPANLIETADDILFFWCCRMLMMGKLLTGRLPFSEIYLHGIIRDDNGKKLSKSLGNGIDPIDIMDRYGCDSLRFSLSETTSPGRDTNLSDNNFESSKHLSNKLWQSSRFCLNYISQDSEMIIDHLDDLRIISEYNDFKLKYHNGLIGYEFKLVCYELRKFFKDIFCDWYIESIKSRLKSGCSSRLLISILRCILIHFHPFMPFITEEIWSYFNDSVLMNIKLENILRFDESNITL